MTKVFVVSRVRLSTAERCPECRDTNTVPADWRDVTISGQPAEARRCRNCLTEWVSVPEGKWVAIQGEWHAPPSSEGDEG